MGVLDLGAGAADGLETLLARMLEEDRFAETQRSNQADEAYRGDSLRINEGIRREQQKANTINQQRLDQDRDHNRTVRTVSMRPIGATVSPQEMEREVAAGTPEALYDQQPEQIPSTSFGSAGTRQNEGKSAQILFKGTQSAQDTERRISDAERARDEANRDRDAARAINAAREGRLQSYGPPVVFVGDSNSPTGSRGVARPDAVGQPGPAAATATARLNAYRRTLQMIQDMKGHTADEYASALGPLDATVGAKVQQFLPKPISSAANKVGLAGGGPKGEQIRTNLNRLKSFASFDEGGKQFTGTEQALLESFLALATQQPETAILRLGELEKSLNNTMRQLETGGGGAGGGSRILSITREP